ncbi:MAG TPA: NB-ARC domain-containing protein [Herpetosiphonaceae bacterium]
MSAAPEWTEDRVEDLLQHPHRLVEKEPWRGVIAAAGGLAGLYDQLRQLPLKDKQRAVLVALLDHPGAGVAAYTALLHIHPTTFARQQRALIQSVALHLNAAAEAAAPVRRPSLPLRPPVGDFVGRAAELELIVAALRRADGAGPALAAIHGMAGAGKTELAALATQRLRDDFPDGQLAVKLRGTQAAPLAPELALQTVIRAVTDADRLPDDLGSLETLFRSALAGKRLLLIADDARDAAQVRPLVPPQGCALLATTRQRWTLPGLASVELDPLPAAEAALLRRGLCARLTPEQAAQAAAAVGCLPLALRIAGALLRTNPNLAVDEYLRQLAAIEHRLAALRDPADPLLDVGASLELSYAALPAAAQEALRRLSVLAGDFDISLGLATIGQGEDGEDSLHALLRHNLLRYDPASARWRLHDLIRALARRHLLAAG